MHLKDFIICVSAFSTKICEFGLQGSFERIHDLSSPGSLPGNYAEVSENHALDGCYVLGLAHRYRKYICSYSNVQDKADMTYGS